MFVLHLGYFRNNLYLLRKRPRCFIDVSKGAKSNNFCALPKIMGIPRGALIVFEGCDRSGKSTQCKKLVDSLVQRGIKAQLMKFPDRTSVIGKMINDYLTCESEIQDNAVHLLFSANRWESVPRMKSLLENGTTLIVDRYAYSGVAFTAAKPGFGINWCKQPDVGLPRPDAVLYLTLTVEEAAKREAFGGERYEKAEFQRRVAKNFNALKENNWTVIDASKSISALHGEIHTRVSEVIERAKHNKLETLWTHGNHKEGTTT